VTRAVAIAMTALAVAAAPSPARADDDDAPVPQSMRFAERGDNLVVTATLTRIFDSAAYEALDSGFASTVVIRMWVYRAGSGEPVSFQLLQRRCVFDLWEEVYDLRLDGPGGRVTKKVKFRADALKLLTALDQVPIARKADIPFGSNHVLAVEAELNPVSEQTMAEVRRWLTQGTGGGLDRGGSFFGSFVSVFVNPKVAAADRVIRVQSQPFYRPQP
jgi:hypothetical protein